MPEYFSFTYRHNASLDADGFLLDEAMFAVMRASDFWAFGERQKAINDAAFSFAQEMICLDESFITYFLYALLLAMRRLRRLLALIATFTQVLE